MRTEAKRVSSTIGELLNIQSAAKGSAEFLILPDTSDSLSFVQVSDGVALIQAFLTQHGFKSGDRVAVILSNGKESALFLLAVMAAGGVAVPLNPRFTSEEIGQALLQAGTRFVVCEQVHGLDPLFTELSYSKIEENIDGLGVRIFSMQDERTTVKTQRPISDGHASALILFTSGTTGAPKGVVLSHVNLLTNALFVSQGHKFTSDDVALCILPLFHINGLVITLLTPLLTGMAVVLPQRFHADRFWGWVSDYRVTWFSAVPTILSLLLSHPSPDPVNWSTLRFARSASAPLPVAVLESFEQRFSIPVIETYGISEAACQVTANPLPPQQRKPGSAGKPVGNLLQIVDSNGSEQLPGVVGEVQISGDNVFNGYLDNPVADKEALVNGWFRTGDLGYLDQDGYLFLTGRKKELINRAGEKISPREVEEVIHRLPQVESVGVVGVPHRLYGEEVAAFITLRPESVLSADTICHFCREHLAGFKTPKEVFFIDEFPKGPSGKIQRRRLIDLYTDITGSCSSERQL